MITVVKMNDMDFASIEQLESFVKNSSFVDFCREAISHPRSPKMIPVSWVMPSS